MAGVIFLHSMNRTQKAVARISGSGVQGTVCFSQRRDGVLVTVWLKGLPQTETGFFAVHIHMGGDCRTPGGHWNPTEAAHPVHAGDLPPVLSCRGRAIQTVLTCRFRVSDVVGRTVVIHAGPDDFRTQPSGNPGAVLACGVIQRC